MSLSLFHDSVQEWFKEELGKPTEVQEKSWPSIKNRNNTLIAAPTGSGKTLAAFLVAIDELVRSALKGNLNQVTLVVYVSPLKALSNDIERNLQVPLKGILSKLKKIGLKEIKIDVAVRTGDTTSSARAAMLRKPPHIIVTTPESLYLLLTSTNGRKLLSTVKTVIIDEIHAVVGNKRGSHLSLTLERLENLTAGKLTRIGLSATQKPIERVADFLTGANNFENACTIINTGHRRNIDLELVLPHSNLSSIMSNDVWTEIYSKLVDLIHLHATTLIFVNTRRLAERLSHQLATRIGKDKVTAHHGSMSKEHRELAEKQLKEGKLKALVATASLELGIDIGSVDLVCQISSPRSISTFLQRIGRSGHSISGTPKGRLFPLTRNDLLECVAIIHAVRNGELDKIIIPDKPLDVLAQQIIAEVSCREYDKKELFNVFRNADPYKDLSEHEYDEVIEMLSEGFSTARGRKSAYIHYDRIHRKLRPSKAARLTALVSGGTIPDNFDYDVILDPEGAIIGSVNEDFAVESLPGDIFQLGNNSWRIRKIENGKVRVEDAGGMPPNMPFWIGEAPGRTAELSLAVCNIVEEIDKRLKDVSGELTINDPVFSTGKWKDKATGWLRENVKIQEEAADQLVLYLGVSKINLGNLPSANKFIIERFFDKAGDMHLVIHSLYGSRFNRAWGLALRKRFCRKFNFELQAAADENAIILSLGVTHSFPLHEVFSYLNSASVRKILEQALLDAPMFEIRWRWNASTALAVLRRRAGKRVPAQLQRMQSEDLISLVFPDQLACLENISGDRQIPDHPLVKQTIHDCLYVAMDIEKLESVLDGIKRKNIQTVSKDVSEPSSLAQEILVAQPYAFLDNAPVEERRVQAVMSRRWVEINDAKDLGSLDEKAIQRVKEEAWPQARTADELYDVLILSGYLTEEEGINKSIGGNWTDLFHQLKIENRASTVHVNNTKIWVAAEKLPDFYKIFPYLRADPEIKISDEIIKELKSTENPFIEILRGRLEILGPTEAEIVADSLKININDVKQAFAALENEGFILKGRYTPGSAVDEWCERRLLARIHRYTIETLRQNIEPVPQVDFMRFLFSWHNILQDKKPEGQASLQKVLDLLEGFEAQSVAWEGDILPARLKEYDHVWLDLLFFSGNFIWGRFNERNKIGNATPIRTSPVSIVKRKNLDMFISLNDTDDNETELSGYAKIVLEILDTEGALFFDQIFEQASVLMPVQVENALSELVTKGIVTSDSFTGLRTLLIPEKYKNSRRTRNGITFDFQQAGRWWKLRGKAHQNNSKEQEKNIEKLAHILLKRYGVIFRKLVEKEKLLPVWRLLLKTLRKMEARGEVRGGRFIQGFWGEQFALPDAVTSLRAVHKGKTDDQFIAISASDPLNLTGVITPGKRIPAVYSNRILYKNGIPVVVREGKEIFFLDNFDEKEKWRLQNALVKRNIQQELKPYLVY